LPVICQLRVCADGGIPGDAKRFLPNRVLSPRREHA
jgi:hypothetical protein